MAIPSGSGTEVLKVSKLNPTDVSEQVLINGVADHIYTVLSIITCETTGNAEAFSMYIKHQGSTAFYILASQALAGRETFIWNDRIVLSGTDELVWVSDGACNIELVCSYIDQDWT
jgi:hypothetical protein